jgi:hypothetical protein
MPRESWLEEVDGDLRCRVALYKRPVAAAMTLAV